MPKKRRVKPRDLKPRLHIFCEGEKTEPNYLNGYRETRKGADPSWTKPHEWNPYTDVYRLLDAIDEFGKKYIEE